MRLICNLLALLALALAADAWIFDSITKAFIKPGPEASSDGVSPAISVEEALMAAQAATDSPDLATAFRTNPDGISTSHVRDPKGEKRAKRVYKTPDKLPLVALFRRVTELFVGNPLVQVGAAASVIVLLIFAYKTMVLSARAARIERKRDDRRERIQQRKREKEPQKAVPADVPRQRPKAGAPTATSSKLKAKAGQQLEPDEVKQIIQQRRERALAKKQVPGIKQQLTPKRKTLQIDTAAE